MFQNILKKQIKELGLEILEDSMANKMEIGLGSLYTRLQGTMESAPIRFSCHIDKDSEGELILGEDNKKRIVALVEMVHRLKKENIPHRTLEFIFSSREDSKMERIFDDIEVYDDITKSE